MALSTFSKLEQAQEAMTRFHGTVVDGSQFNHMLFSLLRLTDGHR